VTAVAAKFEDLKETAKTNSLNFVTSQKAVFHTGWKSSDIIGPRFHTLYEEACENSRKQEASLDT
jgi:hypothetical protein